jgi:hypothetical protein
VVFCFPFYASVLFPAIKNTQLLFYFFRNFIKNLGMKPFQLLLISACLFLLACGPKEESDPVNSGEETKKDLAPVTVNEFFEYLKNPQFEKTEMIGGEIPYYARRMFEVRTANASAELKKVQNTIRRTLPKAEEDQDPIKRTKPNAASLKKIQQTLDAIENIYGQRGTNINELSTYLSESGTNLKDEKELALAVLTFKKNCFRLSIQDGMPLSYVEELNGLAKDSVFVPTYIEQRADEKTEEITEVQFIFNGIIFRFHPMSQEDYFDSQLITAAANLALRSKKSPERYYQLNDDVHVILGTKEQVLKLVERFGLKLK